MSDYWDEYAKTSNASYALAVPAASTQVVPENDGRTSLLIQNVGSNPVWLAWRMAASVGGGIRLSKIDTAGLNALQLCLTEDGRAVRGPVFAIGDGGASIVAVVESIHPCHCMRTGMGKEPWNG